MGSGNKTPPAKAARIRAAVEMAIESTGRANWTDIARECGSTTETVKRIWSRRHEDQAAPKRPALGVVATIGPDDALPDEGGADPLTCSSAALLVQHARQIDATLAGDLADTARVSLLKERIPAWQAARAAVAAEARGTGKTIEQMQREVSMQMERLPAALAVAAVEGLRRRGLV